MVFIICFVFCFMTVRQHEVEGQGKEVGRIKEELEEGKYDQNILYGKS